MRQEAGPQPSSHELFVKKAVFEHLKSGEKKYEVRVKNLDVSNENYPVLKIKTGDTIVFSDGAGNTVEKTVLRLSHHHSFEDFLEEVDPEDVMPDMTYDGILNAWKTEIDAENAEYLFGIVVFELQ